MSKATIQADSTPAAAAPIQSAAEAERLINHLCEVMALLLNLLEEETELVRAGKLADISRLEPRKAELARLYLADAALVKANGVFMARAVPQQFAELRQGHDAFHALLQINLAVLATAHAVSEGLIRGVAGELARKAAPQTYGGNGRASTPGIGAYQPVALSRRL
jgi:hypothetical protein